MSVGIQSNSTDFGTGTADEDFSAIGLSYAVSDDLSVSYNISEVDYESSTLQNQEATGVSFSYTSGGLTVSATHSVIDNVAGAAAADSDAAAPTSLCAPVPADWDGSAMTTLH